MPLTVPFLLMNGRVDTRWEARDECVSGWEDEQRQLDTDWDGRQSKWKAEERDCVELRRERRAPVPIWWKWAPLRRRKEERAAILVPTNPTKRRPDELIASESRSKGNFGTFACSCGRSDGRACDANVKRAWQEGEKSAPEACHCNALQCTGELSLPLPLTVGGHLARASI